jgi:hypothetical protein
MKRLLTISLLGALAAALLPAVWAQGGPPPKGSNPPLFRGEKKGKDSDETVRSLQGLVVNAGDQPVEGAVVKLKDAKTLQVKSFITLTDGQYRFHGLSTNTDYKVWADHNDKASDERTLSVFDSRRNAVINLKVDKKRDEKN